MAEPFAPYVGIEGAALTGGEGGDALHNILMGVLQGTVSVPERIIKAAQATAPGLRREDFTDIPGPEQPGGELRKEAMQTALGLAGTSMPFAINGAAGVFGGRLAQNADLNALQRAEKMAASGAEKKAIWDETGWFKGGDDKWRFEIPDYHSQMRQGWHDNGLPNGEMAPIASQLWHKDLYQAYPDLRRITGTVEKTAAEGGSYSPGSAGDARTFARDETINMRGPNAPAARSVALHEMQHAIQEREGFAQGGSPSMFTQGDDAILSRDALSWRREMERFPGTPHEKDLAAEKAYRDMGAVDWMPSKDAREIAKYPQDNPDSVLKQVVELYGVDKQTTPYNPKDLYMALPGEIEARNVQRRRDMTPEELKAKPPWETEHWMDRASSSPTLEKLFGSGRVGSLEGGASSVGPQMSIDNIFRGEYAGNKGGNFWTRDPEFAQQFTQSGLPSEVKKRRIDTDHVFVPEKPVYAGDEKGVDAAIAEAKAKGLRAVQLSEGAGQPDSIFVFDKRAIIGMPIPLGKKF